MAFYHDFLPARSTEIDFPALLGLIRTTVSDAAAGAGYSGAWTSGALVRVKKSTTWSAANISAVQNVLNTSPALTAQRTAQNEIDTWSVTMRAFALALLDEINRLRTQPTTTFVSVTPAQMLSAIRDKAGTL